MPDTATAKALREKRAALAAQARKDILEKAEAEDRDLTAEEQEQWAKVMGGTRPDGTTLRGEVDVLADRIARLEKSESVSAQLAARVGDPEVGRGPLRGVAGDGAAAADPERLRALALGAWCRAQLGKDVTDEQAEACRAVGVRPHSPELLVRLPSTEQIRAVKRSFRSAHPTRALERTADIGATLSDYSGPSGGYLVAPTTLRTQLEVNMLAFGGMRQVADEISTSTGERIAWPTADDTNNKGALLGESVSIGSSVDPAFAQVYWDAYKFTSKPVLVPYELIEDAIFDLPGMLGAMFGERLGRITNDYYTTGTGASQPKGVVTAAGSFAAASATAIAADDLLGLQHSIDPAYRTGASFMCHDSILLALRKLKDGVGRYLWSSGLALNLPDTLDGQPLTVNQSMDSTIASGKKTVLYGQMPKYKIRRVGTMRLYRLQERYRDTDQDGFIALIREDGNLLDAGTKPVKYLSH